MPYAVKQIVIQELETTRLQRAAIASGANPTATATPATSSKESKPKPAPKLSQEDPTNVPNHLRQLNPVQLQPATEKVNSFYNDSIDIANFNY